MAMLLAALLLAAPLWAQAGPGEVDFLDDRLLIPEAALYDSSQYQASGVEAAFAEAKRQAYDLGQYPQAAQRLAPLVDLYPQKSALWIYLARSYFHSQDFESARQTLTRAAAVMPELGERLWQPLREGLLEEVRRLANQLQAQVDFYPQRQADFAPLLRLYRFLQDSTAAQALVRSAGQRRADLYRQAEVASGAQRLSYLAAAAQWDRLAGSLGAELDSTAVAPPGEVGIADSLKQVEILRLLQLRVDYYVAKPQEYQQLFGEYLRLGRRTEAAAVVTALEREIQRLDLLAALAPNAAEAGKHRDQSAVLSAIRQQLQAQLGSAATPP